MVRLDRELALNSKHQDLGLNDALALMASKGQELCVQAEPHVHIKRGRPLCVEAACLLQIQRDEKGLLTSSWMPCRSSASSASPVRGSMISRKMVAPHFAFRASFTRYLAAKLPLQRRRGFIAQRPQPISLHPKLLLTIHNVEQCCS